MNELPSAEHIAGCIGLIALKHNDENAVEKAVKIIRNDRCNVLKAAAQEALDHPKAPAEAILKLREKM